MAIVRFILAVTLTVWAIGGPILGFVHGINFERRTVPVCYAPSEDSYPLGCDYDGKRNVWVRDPITPESILSNRP